MKLYFIVARSRSGMIAGASVEIALNEEHAKDILVESLAAHAQTSKRSIREHFNFTVKNVEEQVGRRISIGDQEAQVSGGD